MPKHLENILKRSAKRAGLQPGTERYNAYVYGTLAKIEGAKNGKAKSGKGRRDGK